MTLVFDDYGMVFSIGVLVFNVTVLVITMVSSFWLINETRKEARKFWVISEDLMVRLRRIVRDAERDAEERRK